MFKGTVWIEPINREWELKRNFSYDAGKRGTITAPSGMTTDGATVPFPLTLFFPRIDPRYLQSVIIHDAGFKHYRHLSRMRIDSIFHSALKEEGVPFLLRNFLVAGVRVGGVVLEGTGYFRPKQKV